MCNDWRFFFFFPVFWKHGTHAHLAKYNQVETQWLAEFLEMNEISERPWQADWWSDIVKEWLIFFFVSRFVPLHSELFLRSLSLIFLMCCSSRWGWPWRPWLRWTGSALATLPWSVGQRPLLQSASWCGCCGARTQPNFRCPYRTSLISSCTCHSNWTPHHHRRRLDNKNATMNSLESSFNEIFVLRWCCAELCSLQSHSCSCLCCCWSFRFATSQRITSFIDKELLWS